MQVRSILFPFILTVFAGFASGAAIVQSGSIRFGQVPVDTGRSDLAIQLTGLTDSGQPFAIDFTDRVRGGFLPTPPTWSPSSPSFTTNSNLGHVNISWGGSNVAFNNPPYFSGTISFAWSFATQTVSPTSGPFFVSQYSYPETPASLTMRIQLNECPDLTYTSCTPNVFDQTLSMSGLLSGSWTDFGPERRIDSLFVVADTSVPEPATWATAGISAVMILWRVRSVRRRSLQRHLR